MRLRTLAAISVVALALAGASCGGDDGGGDDDGGGTGSTGGSAADLTIAGTAYDPTTLSVSEGQTITIVNEDSFDHTFTTDDEGIDETIPGGETVEVTLSDVASGGFHCEIHSSMTGTLEVS